MLVILVIQPGNSPHLCVQTHFEQCHLMLVLNFGKLKK